MLEVLRKRSFKGPRRSDSINFLVFGVAFGHSLRRGGPGVFDLQPWLFELIRGLDQTNEQVMTLIIKHDIPKHTGAIDLVELSDKLYNAQS